MDGPTLATALADLARAFPQREITAGTLGVYVRELSDLPEGRVAEACGVLMRTSEFFPTIHTIRETVAERTLALPDEAEALAQVNARVQWGRLREGDAPPVHPLVLEALTAVGGYYAFRGTSEPAVLRGQFLRIYRALRHARVAGAIVGDVSALDSGPKLRELTA